MRSSFSRRAVVVTLALLFAASIAAATPATARGDDAPPAVAAPDCAETDESTLRAAECAGIAPVDDLDPADTEAVISRAAAASAAAAALPHECRYHSEAVFYTAADWIRLVRILAADASMCADFYVSVPALADKTRFRPMEPARIRAFGPHFHPLAEVHYSGWQAYVASTGSTWYDAGVEAGKRLIAAGYESWAVNELSSAVRQGHPNQRANAAAFIRGLYDGSGARGLVFIVGIGQRTSPLDVYRTNLSGWLLDSLFWSSISESVRFWAQEVYGDIRAWGVSGASRHDRTTHLAEYLMHGANLAEAVPADAARSFLRERYVALANAAWPWPAGVGFGFTDVPAELMQSYVSEQVFAVRHFAGAHPQGAPSGRWGAAWAPRTGAPVAGTALILERMASALHNAYEEGGGTQTGACGPPGDHNWCFGEWPDAAFVDGWAAFLQA
jgi:hypothetical protein